MPLRTKDLTGQEILEFRDLAFIKYHTYEPFLKRIEKIWQKNAENIKKMAQIKLKRKILGHTLEKN